MSLAPIGGAPFSLDATLGTVGVVDGDLLALQPVPKGPPAPRIVEDIADAAVIFSAAREKPWGIDHIRRAATAALIGLILVATALAVVHRIATDELLGLYTVSGLAAATVLGALLSRGRCPALRQHSPSPRWYRWPPRSRLPCQAKPLRRRCFSPRRA